MIMSTKQPSLGLVHKLFSHQTPTKHTLIPIPPWSKMLPSLLHFPYHFESKGPQKITSLAYRGYKPFLPIVDNVDDVAGNVLLREILEGAPSVNGAPDDQRFVPSIYSIVATTDEEGVNVTGKVVDDGAVDGKSENVNGNGTMDGEAENVSGDEAVDNLYLNSCL